MTVDEKALALIEKWETGEYIGGAVQKKAALQVAIIDALREQDRDTRHACADAVTKLRGQMGEGGDPFTAAGNACMNVKAV
jgi:alpha-D-ribose 1-methylphosphonate 5-triphosphate synthase subunit PhnG